MAFRHMSGRGNFLSWLVLAAVLVSVITAFVVVAARGPAPPTTISEQARAIAGSLRCPVCQDLSVADSPSSVARQMRASIARDLRAGRSPAEIKARFVAGYGEWVLLAPTRRGLNLAAWLAPIVLLLAGIGVVVVALRRWTAGSVHDRGPVATAPSPISAADRALLERAISWLPDGEER